MRFVVCIRNPLEVARSLERRNNIPVPKGAMLWYHYMRASLEDTEGSPRLFTFFDDFFDGGSLEIERLLRFCGLLMPGDRSQLQSAISSELRHHTSAIQILLEAPALTPECKLFYLGLRAILSEHPSRVEGRDDRGGHDAVSVSAFVKLFQDGDESDAVSDRAAPSAELQSRSGDHRAATKLKRLLESLKRF